MHDWVLVCILFLWEEGGQCRIELRDSSSKKRYINASGVSKLSVPKKEEWGSSMSINETVGPTKKGDAYYFNIEMQSGDLIELIADHIDFDWK